MYPNAAPSRARVLCVDDEPNVLQGLSLHLGRRYEVAVASSGADALTLIASSPAFAVICSDMRMPGMDGATFLSRSREIAPDSTRILLTGQADLDSAIAAINDGRIFRFLTKPCPPDRLLEVFAEAAEQHRLLRVERDMLETTVRGAVKAMTDLLALANPVLFGRAQRIRDIALELASQQGAPEVWPLEVAALLSQAGMIALAPETANKIATAAPLSAEEEAQVSRVALMAEDLIAEIPRLDAVREVLIGARMRLVDPAQPHVAARRDSVPLAGRILRVASDFEHLERQGTPDALAVETLRARAGVYDPVLLDALAALRGAAESTSRIADLTVDALQPGMVLAADLFTVSGMLAAARGYEVTTRFLERVRNAGRHTLREPVRVVVAV